MPFNILRKLFLCSFFRHLMLKGLISGILPRKVLQLLKKKYLNRRQNSFWCFSSPLSHKTFNTPFISKIPFIHSSKNEWLFVVVFLSFDSSFVHWHSNSTTSKQKIHSKTIQAKNLVAILANKWFSHCVLDNKRENLWIALSFYHSTRFH